MLAGIEKFLLFICDDLKLFQKLLGSGNQYGVKLSYKLERPDNSIFYGNFIGDDDVCLILGDNILWV